MSSHIEIRQGDISLQGKGHLTLRPARAVPSLSGYVIFDGDISFAAIEEITRATITCTAPDGRQTIFNDAFCCGGTTPGPDRGGFTVKFEAMSAT